MKNKKQPQLKKKLSLSKEKVAILTNAQSKNLLGGGGGGGTNDPSVTFTQPGAGH